MECFIYQKDNRKYVEAYHIVQPILQFGDRNKPLTKLRLVFYLNSYKYLQIELLNYFHCLIKKPLETQGFFYIGFADGVYPEI